MFINQKFDSIIDLVNTFNTEKKCVEHLERIRRDWNVVSPFDLESKVYVCKWWRYKCKNSWKYFNVKTWTLFDNTKIPLQKWFLAIRLITSHKKWISSLQLGRDLKITQKSAWFMLQRIRTCFWIENDKLDWSVEVDETYVWGKNKNRHAHKKIKNSQGRSTKDKTAVVGMVERWGKLIAKKVDDVWVQSLTKEVIKNVKHTAVIHSDEWLWYNHIKELYQHYVVKHGQWEFVVWDSHTNTIEWFWSLLKRWVIGIYHSVSKKHLDKYVDEFVFRYNSRKMTEAERMNYMFKLCENRLTYKDLING